tara:strand:+ start:1036 stop:1203 length:168 start_codon:yes stop_codon:yes gene_type:complete
MVLERSMLIKKKKTLVESEKTDKELESQKRKAKQASSLHYRKGVKVSLSKEPWKK